ncbi:MAG TPA: hypothetical protein PK466_07245 [Thermotogota bacterium]|nr:hypothetical protein [Thermotogota bacterium]HPJ89081.1 hypothetical protein [Thermotogota bacterium]HPR96108.1 hypothetical protein [Thermotogota bacterium]
MINHKFRKSQFFLLLLTAFFLSTIVGSDFSDTLNAWKDRGYKITVKDGYNIVEFKFNYDTVGTLDLKNDEMILYTFTDQIMEKPTDAYLHDIGRILENSAISTVLTEAILSVLSTQDYNFGKESDISGNYRLKTTIYSKSSILLQFSHVVSATDISEQIDTESFKLLKEKYESVEAEVDDIKAENQRLSEETLSKSRTIERLELENRDLEASLDKYRNLSAYKESITENLQKTIVRYKEIERQKLEEIELKTGIIETMNNQIDEIIRSAGQREQELNEAIEELENRIRALEEENKLLRESEMHYESRLHLINALYNLQISESEIPLALSATFTTDPSDTPVENPVMVSNDSEGLIMPTEKEREIIPVLQDSTDSSEQQTENKSDSEPVPPLQNSRLITVRYFNSGKMTHQLTYTYDQKGNVIGESITLPSGQTVSTVESKYYENGKLYEKSTYQNSEFTGKGVYQYNTEGLPARIFIYDSDGITGYQVYDYDKSLSSELPVLIRYYEDNRLKISEKNTFDKEGNIIRTERRDTDDHLISFTIFEIRASNLLKAVYYEGSEMKYRMINAFDDENRLISQETFDQNDTLISNAEFIYQ